MKYFIVSFTIALGLSWLLVNNSAKRSRHSSVQLHGKVYGLTGQIKLNIQDKRLTLHDQDRFSLFVKAENKKQLHIEIAGVPRGQECNILKSYRDDYHIGVDIYCESTANIGLNTSSR